MKHDELLKLIEDYYENTDENVVGVEYGFKEIDGKITDEKSIVFSVKEKKPKDQIPENQLLPKEIILNDVKFKTDVIESEFELLCDSNFYSWNTTPPSNRNLIRPIKGGLSVANYDSLPGYVGTLGFLAIDDDTGSLVGVSNNHVLIDDAFICSERNSNSIISNVKGDNTNQPNGPSNSIGIVKKYYPISSGSYNYVDVALTTLDSGVIDNNISYLQEGLTGWTQSLSFASTTEINNLLNTKPFLYSTGRTTGAKGEGDTKLLIHAFPAVVQVPYKKQNVDTTVIFSDCIVFIASGATTPQGSVCIYPIAPGDSGSALIADFNGVRKIIGLVFAGSTDGIFGIACRIDRVAELMNISEWNGELVNFSDKNNIEEFTIDGLSNQPFIIDGGKKFWQVGLRNKV